MDSIQSPISGELVTGFKRLAKHEGFVILPDLNMIQQVRVVTLDQTGTPLINGIESNETLTEGPRQAARFRYQDQLVTKQTAGAFIDVKTGKIVAEGTEGSVPQRDYFQAITIGDIKKMGIAVTDKTSFASLLYALIGAEIGKIDGRGDL